jgi:hypothetical protein
MADEALYQSCKSGHLAPLSGSTQNRRAATQAPGAVFAAQMMDAAAIDAMTRDQANKAVDHG